MDNPEKAYFKQVCTARDYINVSYKPLGDIVVHLTNHGGFEVDWSVGSAEDARELAKALNEAAAHKELTEEDW